MQNEDRILLIDKPTGITSFDVIRILRKKLGIKKMGHSGTLDPLATGLMLIATGKKTKELTALIGLPKTYEAEIRLGIKTDSGDITGTVIEEKEIPAHTDSEVLSIVQGMLGKHVVSVPKFSAIKKNGKPLYEYAREGKEVEIPQKTMEVLSVRLITRTPQKLVVFFEVTSGTYIRTLAEMLAQRLGTVGTIENLRRLSIGVYNVIDAERIETNIKHI